MFDDLSNINIKLLLTNLSNIYLHLLNVTYQKVTFSNFLEKNYF